MKKFTFILVMMLMTLAGVAQPKIGIRAGYNYSNIYEFLEFSSNDGSAWKSGLNFGVVADFNLTEKILFRPGLYYSMKGYKNDNDDSKHRYNYLEAPLLGVFQQPIGNNLKLELQMGPYFGIGIGGKSALYGAPFDLSTFKFEKTRFDWGLNIGCGINIKKVYVGASFEDGFISYGRQYKHHCLMANVGYSF